MSAVRIQPGPVRGRLEAPPSKSYTHRALVVGHLSGRRFRITNPLDSDDTRATARALSQLGTKVVRSRGVWRVVPGPFPLSIRGSIDCGESGTTLRFLTAVAARAATRVRFTGRPRLGERPMTGLLDALERLGAHVRVGSGGFPLEVEGPIHGGSVRLDASTSSQFASSLLLTLPTLADDSRVELTGRIVSAPYLDATLAVLAHHRVRVVRRGRTFLIPGRQKFLGAGFRVPGDASSAAYFWAAGALAGDGLQVHGIPPEWPQADRAILGVLRKYGARITTGGNWVAVAGGARRPFTTDLTAAPDLYPLVGVLAALATGSSRLQGAPQVALKESDRRAGTERLARALGATTRRARGALVVRGTRSPLPIRLSHLRDHRLVMSAAVGALAASGPSRIGEAEATEKSFPGFWDALRRVGVEVTEA